MHDLEESDQATPGHRVRKAWPRVAADVLALFEGLSVSALSDGQYGHGVMSPGLRHVGSTHNALGTAVTVTITPGNGHMIRRAITAAAPGDVLVVNGHGCDERAVLGEHVMRSAYEAGIVAVIVDGAVRDTAGIATLRLPTMARCISPRSGTGAGGYGEVGYPAAVGGVVVEPGDIVIVDSDGAIIVGAADAPYVAQRAKEVERSKDARTMTVP